MHIMGKAKQSITISLGTQNFTLLYWPVLCIIKVVSVVDTSESHAK